MTQSYSALLSSIRACEGELDAHHASYAHYAGRVSTSYAASGSISDTNVEECTQLEGRIEKELERLEELVEAMDTLLERSSNVSGAQRHTLSMHQDALQERSRRYKRTQNSLREATDRAALLNSVRAEIHTFNNSRNNINSNSDAGEAAFLTERETIDSSNRMTDRILQQAYETRDEMFRQKDILSSARDRMSGIAASMPSLNSIMSMIRTRRRRDSIIIGSLMAACTLILLWYITS